MKRLGCRVTVVVVMVLFAAGSVVFCSPDAWAKPPTFAEWKALKREHGIANSKHNVGKALKNYHKYKDAAIGTREAKGSPNWTKQYKSYAKASGQLEKKLTAYRKDIKIKYPTKNEFLKKVKQMKREAANSIISANGALSRAGGGDRQSVTYSLKAYIKKFKKAAKKLSGTSSQEDVCAVYTGEFRGIGTVMPEVQKHFDEYQKVVRKWNKGFGKATKLCRGSNFDAEKAIYAMKVSVEYVEQSMSAVLK
jgi:hypothetical protein